MADALAKTIILARGTLLAMLVISTEWRVPTGAIRETLAICSRKP